MSSIKNGRWDCTQCNVNQGKNDQWFDGTDVSFWFNSYTKDELIKLSDEDFIAECKQSIEIANSI